MEEEASSFSLRSGTDSFVSRSHDVFAGLGDLEDKHSAFLKATASSRDKDDVGLIKNDPDEDDEYINQAQGKDRSAEETRSWSHGRSKLSKTRDSDYEPRSYSRSPDRVNESSDIRGDNKRGADGNFKRPARLPQRLSRQPIPDFKKHPEKYTCYSLGDVSEKDMSEKANQRAAFDFLEELRLEKEKQAMKQEGLPEEEPKFSVATAACSQGKIVFSHPKQQKKETNAAEKSVSKDGPEVSALHPDSDPTNNDEQTEDSETNSVPDDAEINGSLSETSTSSNTFKSRKNVRRHIRTKSSDSDSD